MIWKVSHTSYLIHRVSHGNRWEQNHCCLGQYYSPSWLIRGQSVGEGIVRWQKWKWSWLRTIHFGPGNLKPNKRYKIYDTCYVKLLPETADPRITLWPRFCLWKKVSPDILPLFHTQLFMVQCLCTHHRQPLLSTLLFTAQCARTPQWSLIFYTQLFVVQCTSIPHQRTSLICNSSWYSVHQWTPHQRTSLFCNSSWYIVHQWTLHQRTSLFCNSSWYSVHQWTPHQRLPLLQTPLLWCNALWTPRQRPTLFYSSSWYNVQCTETLIKDSSSRYNLHKPSSKTTLHFNSSSQHNLHKPSSKTTPHFNSFSQYNLHKPSSKTTLLYIQLFVVQATWTLHWNKQQNKSPPNKYSWCKLHKPLIKDQRSFSTLHEVHGVINVQETLVIKDHPSGHFLTFTVGFHWVFQF